MSLLQTFKNLPHAQILMVEVSSGKRKALLLKIAKHLHKDAGDDELYRRVTRLINEFPVAVDKVYKNMEKFKSNINRIKWREYFSYYLDLEEIIEDKYDDLTPEFEHEKMWGLYALIGVIGIFKDFEDVDPTKNMKYGNWLVDVVLPHELKRRITYYYKNDPFHNSYVILTMMSRYWEDVPKLKSYLKYYDEAKRKNELPDEYKDINQLVPLYTHNDGSDGSMPSHGKMVDPIRIMNYITKPYRTIKQKDVFKAIDAHLKEGKDYEFLGEFEKYKMYKPLTQKGASILGMNTEWCTTYGEHCTNPDWQDRNSYFDDYEELFILINKKTPEMKFQLDFDSNQFMDKDDITMNLGNFFVYNKDILEFIFEEPIEGAHTYEFYNRLIIENPKNIPFILEKIEDYNIEYLINTELVYEYLNSNYNEIAYYEAKNNKEYEELRFNMRIYKLDEIYILITRSNDEGSEYMGVFYNLNEALKEIKDHKDYYEGEGWNTIEISNNIKSV